MNLFDMRHHYPNIIENNEIDWHLDDTIKMNTNEWVDFNRVDIDKLEKLLDGYMNKKG